MINKVINKVKRIIKNINLFLIATLGFVISAAKLLSSYSSKEYKKGG
jgi:hypothetical protein